MKNSFRNIMKWRKFCNQKWRMTFFNRLTSNMKRRKKIYKQTKKKKLIKN